MTPQGVLTLVVSAFTAVALVNLALWSVLLGRQRRPPEPARASRRSRGKRA
jgi:hypothetical protein